MNTTKFYYKTLLLIPMILLFMGCEEYLQEKPKGIINPDNFYTNASQIEGVLASAMDNNYGFWSGYGYKILVLFKHDDQIAGGDLVIMPHDEIDQAWRAHYNAILNLNMAIKAMQEGSLEDESQEKMDELMGEAKFIRGWNYFMLVRLYGPVPLPTEDTENYFNANLSRSPISEVYDLIISDFKAAIDKLPVSQQPGEPTRDVAKALLAEAYLTMATHPMNEESYYSDAASLAWEIIQTGRYSLVEDIEQVFSVDTEYGPEMMWGLYANAADPAIHPQVFSDMRGWGITVPEIPWTEEYPDQPRKYAYLEIFSPDGEHYSDIGRDPGIKKLVYAADFGKWVNYSNMPIMRYADVLLIYAEAANMDNGGPTEDAVWAVNQVISRANGYEENPEAPLATIDMSRQAFDEKVIQERNWELCFETGDRWFDLVRKRILKEKVREEYKRNFDENDYLLPIPEQDLRNNPNLTQNDGYPTYK